MKVAHYHCHWHEVENARNVQRSQQFVNDSSTFVESRTVTQFNVFAFILDRWSVMKDFVHFLIIKGLQVNLVKFHDNLKSNEMYNAVLNRMLEA